MKTPLTPWLASLLWAGLLAATPGNPELQRKFTWIDAADPTVAEIRRVADPVIQQNGNRMLSEVNRVLAKKGAEAGIDDLHLKEWKLPVAAPGQPRITAVKRTSLRVRNPASLPDNADLAALLSIRPPWPMVILRPACSCNTSKPRPAARLSGAFTGP